MVVDAVTMAAARSTGPANVSDRGRSVVASAWVRNGGSRAGPRSRPSSSAPAHTHATTSAVIAGAAADANRAAPSVLNALNHTARATGAATTTVTMRSM